MKVRLNANASFAIDAIATINKSVVVGTTPKTKIVVGSQQIIDSSSAQECRN
jgi:hypothetical protein